MDRGGGHKQQGSALANVHRVVPVVAGVPGLQLRALVRALGCHCGGQRDVTAAAHRAHRAPSRTTGQGSHVLHGSCLLSTRLENKALESKEIPPYSPLSFINHVPVTKSFPSSGLRVSSYKMKGRPGDSARHSKT